MYYIKLTTNRGQQKEVVSVDPSTGEILLKVGDDDSGALAVWVQSIPADENGELGSPSKQGKWLTVNPNGTLGLVRG